MALELQYMLGTSPETAAITLYGFMQQNILFDALSGAINKVGSSPLDFLNEVTTVFSMIGLLVLIFSPSLWKAKYLVSWTFLFVAITLGGATGNTIGYDFSKATGKEFLNKDVNGTNLACKTPEELTKGVCYEERSSDQIAINYLGKTSIAAAVEKAADSASSGKMTTVDNGKSKDISSLNVIGFFPQVYIIYATNRFRNNLENALFDLNTRSFAEKSQLLQKMLTAQTPSPQLDMWIYTFDKICASKTNMDTTNLITSGQANVDLFNQRFKVSDLAPLLFSGSVIEENDPDVIAPIMDIYSPTVFAVSPEERLYNKEILSNFLSGYDRGVNENNELISGDDTFRQYTINFPETIKSGVLFWKKYKTPDLDDIGDDINGSEDSLYAFDDLNSDGLNTTKARAKIIKSLEDSMVYKLKDVDAYINNGKLLMETDVSSLPADLIMSKYLVTRTEMYDNKAAAQQRNSPACKQFLGRNSCALGYMQSEGSVSLNGSNIDKTKFVKVSSCGDLLNELSTYYTQAMILDNDDYINKIDKYQATSNTTYYSLPIFKSLTAQKAFLNEVETMGAYCVKQTGSRYSMNLSSNSEELNKCTQQYIDPIIRHYKGAAIGNSLNQSKNKVSAFMADNGNSLTGGLTGITYAVGRGFTDFWTSAVVGLGSLKNAFNAGAYAKILPIIKNILVAFIIVCTPILLLIGLLVPAWAPGVILTTIVTILFLQMTDVIMVVVQSVLIAIEKPLYAISQTSSVDDALEYQAFMEYIWGIAYMSTFAITAFLMFAAGNTKAIMSKMAGLDGNIKSVSQDIYKNGWNLTKQGVGMLAPGMGNSMVSSTGAFKTITGGAAGATNLLSGKTASTAQEWSHAYNSSRISGINENDKIKSDTKSVTDTVKLHSDVSNLMAQGYSKEEALAKAKPRTTSKMMNEHNKEKGIKAFSKELESSMTDDEGLGLYRSDRIKTTDEHGKLLRKANLLSGRNFANTTFTDSHGVRNEASGVDDQTAGLEKFAAENGWKASHVGATQAEIYKNIENSFEKINPNTQYEEFKDGVWNSKTVEHSNMKLHWFKNRDAAIENIQKSGADRLTAEQMLNRVVKFRVPIKDNNNNITGYKYAASKVNDDEGLRMKDPERQAKSSPIKSRNNDKLRGNPGGRKGSAKK